MGVVAPGVASHACACHVPMERRYTRLLRTHPNGVGLSRCYALFCDDVLNDSTQASEYTIGTDGGGSVGGGSKSGGQSMMSGAQRSTISSCVRVVLAVQWWG